MGQRFARSAGRLSTSSQTNVRKRCLTCMDGCSSRSSRPPAEQDPDKGLAEPAERPRRERSDRSGLGAVRRVTAQQAPAAAEADRLRAAGAWSKTAHGAAPWACLWMALVRGGVRWLAEQERRLQAARCEAQTFGLRGGASDLGASRLLMQTALAGAPSTAPIAETGIDA